MEVGEEGEYTYRYTVTTRMTPALRRGSDEPNRLSMVGVVSRCLTSTETMRLIRDGEKGGGKEV